MPSWLSVLGNRDGSCVMADNNSARIRFWASHSWRIELYNRMEFSFRRNYRGTRFAHWRLSIGPLTVVYWP